MNYGLSHDLILLGFLTVFKEVISVTIADLVYETSIRLPGDFFRLTATETFPQQFVLELKMYFRDLRPIPAFRHEQNQSLFSHSLKTIHLCFSAT